MTASRAPVADPHTGSSGWEERLSSVVRRERRGDRNAFVKQYRLGETPARRDIVIARTRQEVTLVERLYADPAFNGRFRVPRLLEARPDEGLLVTEEAPGCLLGDLLLDRRSGHQRCDRAMVLVGRWARNFQQIPLFEPEGAVSHEPDALAAYCDVRLAALRDLGYAWPAQAQRQRLLAWLEATERASSAEDRVAVWTHGDYFHGNILWDGRVLTTIDFAMSKPGLSLLDVTYFLHRTQMLSWQFPWRRLPVARWRALVLRGFGRPDASASSLYRAVTVRHLLCRLVSLVRDPGGAVLQRLHARWLRACVRKAIRQAVGAS